MHGEAQATTVPTAPEPNGIELDGRPRLELTNIVRAWGDRAVLAGASLQVPAGSVVWLGGPNGSGKTTLLRVAARVVVPQSGSISISGLDPARNPRACLRRLGYLSAGDRGLYARLTVLQNLEFWAGVALVERAQRRELTRAALVRFELGDLASSRVDRLSTGQRQRVRLAMTFLHDPTLVLLDEPQNSLDEHALLLLDNALGDVVSRGGGALWCSPAPVAEIRADARLRLSDGQVIAA